MNLYISHEYNFRIAYQIYSENIENLGSNLIKKYYTVENSEFSI